jgi:hypothetical protein
MSFKTSNLTIAECCLTCGRDTESDEDPQKIFCNHTGRKAYCYNHCGEYVSALWVRKTD